MKPRWLWIALVLLALVAGLLLLRSRILGPSAAKPMVAIEDGKTIDFSSGKPVIKDTPADRAALQKAEKEMAEAARGVTFGPRSPGTETAPATTAATGKTPPGP